MSASPSPAAGDRGNAEPGRRCPTGAALRPTNKRGVSSGNRWLGREPPGSRGQPEGVAQEGRRKLKLLAVRIARVGSCGWDTRYGEQRMSPRVRPLSLALLTELQEPRRVEGAVTATRVAGHKGACVRRNSANGGTAGREPPDGWGSRTMAGGVGW